MAKSDFLCGLQLEADYYVIFRQNGNQILKQIWPPQSTGGWILHAYDCRRHTGDDQTIPGCWSTGSAEMCWICM